MPLYRRCPCCAPQIDEITEALWDVNAALSGSVPDADGMPTTIAAGVTPLQTSSAIEAVDPCKPTAEVEAMVSSCLPTKLEVRGGRRA